MTQSHQRGSVLGYVLVGVLLIAALVGGIFVVRHNLSRFKAPATTAQVAKNDTSSDDAVKKKAEADKKAAEDKKAQEQATADAQKKAQEQNSAVQREMAGQGDAAQQPAASASGTNSSTSSTTATQTPHTSTAPEAVGNIDTSRLPHTGPTETLFAGFVGAALLLGASFAYMRSRASL